MRLLKHHLVSLFPQCPRAAAIGDALPKDGLDLTDGKAAYQWYVGSLSITGDDAIDFGRKLLPGVSFGSGAMVLGAIVAAATQGTLKLPAAPKRHELKIKGGPTLIFEETGETREPQGGEAFLNREGLVWVAGNNPAWEYPILRFIEVKP